MTNHPIFLSWIEHHGRSADLATALGIEAVFVAGGKGNLARRYIRQWRATTTILNSANPRAVVVMQPPLPALLAVLSTRAGRRARIIGDLHTGTFEDPKWSWALPWILKILAKRGSAIVTNEALASRTRSAGVPTIVMHDMIVDFVRDDGYEVDVSLLRTLEGKDFVLVPLAYANDEPIDALLKAAAQDPEITWVLTGRPPASVRARAGANVHFSGYVSNATYGRLVELSTVIAALTNREFTMQRAGYEALAAAKTLVTASTKTLSSYFGDSVIYTDGTSDSIANSARQAIASSEEYSARMDELKQEKIAEQGDSLAAIRSTLEVD